MWGPIRVGWDPKQKVLQAVTMAMVMVTMVMVMVTMVVVRE